MTDTAATLREKIAECQSAIDSGKFDAWHYEDLSRLQDELREHQVRMTPADGGAAGDWIEWSGGECPVPADTLVFVKFRLGTTMRQACRAEYVRWSHRTDTGAGDVTAYRVVQP